MRTMLARNILRTIITVLGLLFCGTRSVAAQNLDETNVTYVKHIENLPEFFEYTNRNDSYTVIKYYTEWCGHCKRLKPIFEEVAGSYSSPDSGTLVNFIEVDCDLFGGFLCWDIDSYPVIRILVPRREPLVVVERNDKDAPFWARWIRKLVGPGVDPNWNVHPRRITGYEGNRTYDSLRNFIDAVIARDELNQAVYHVIDESYECDPSREKLCIVGKDYVRDLVDDGVISRVTAEGNNVGLFSVLGADYLEKERAKLENIVRIFSRDDNSTQEEELLTVEFQLKLVDYIEDIAARLSGPTTATVATPVTAVISGVRESTTPHHDEF